MAREDNTANENESADVVAIELTGSMRQAHVQELARVLARLLVGQALAEFNFAGANDNDY